MACGIWNNSTDNIDRMYFVSSGPTCICSGGDPTTNNLDVYSSSANGYVSNNNLVIQNNGKSQIRGSLYISGTTKLNYDVTCLSSLNVSGITTLNNNTIIKGY